MQRPSTNLTLRALRAAYRAQRFTPRELIADLLARIDEAPNLGVWIARVPQERLLAQAEALGRRAPDDLPLYGVPFAIKDNIDLVGLPTTAGCPAYAYEPAASAFVVQRLIDAGALPLGKTNLDQFATGLVGTRSPFGACRNPFDPEFIAGGSSSGSAVAVATGLASFALGTDTAGSGRVPAGFNNIVGLKPTRGLLSTRGVVPACRMLDCVSIFALTVEDACRVRAAAAGYDARDPWSRHPPASAAGARAGRPFRFGLPDPKDLEFHGDHATAREYQRALERLQALGGLPVQVDFEPFLEAAAVLYQGPWVAERATVAGALLAQNPGALLPELRTIIGDATRWSAADLFRAQHRLFELKRATDAVWSQIDFLVTPTAPTIYRIAEVAADPLRLNANLGRYTNCVNLLDLAALAVPAGFRDDGLPCGVTLVGPAWSDDALAHVGALLHAASVERAGALAIPLPDPSTEPLPPSIEHIALAVCGAHMQGLPLNGDLTDRGARLLRRARTAPEYRLYALPDGPPQRPGLVRTPDGGAAIEVEVWAVPVAQLGAFIAAIPAPLGVGRLKLEDGTEVSGFLCEAYAAAGARDITALGGWRRYLAEAN